MSEFNKYSTDGGATFIDVEDSNAVHYGDQSKGYVGKNLFKNTGLSTTSNNVAFTHNSDDSIGLNNTASATTFYTIGSVASLAGINQNVILSGCPTGGDVNNGYSMGIRTTSNKNVRHENIDIVDTGNGFRFNPSNPLKDSDGNSVSISDLVLVMRIGNGVNVSDKTFYPMIRLASIPDSTYEPYLTPNTEINNKLSYADNGILGAKNLIDIKYRRKSMSYTSAGVTFTINDDGTVSATGTSTNELWFPVTAINTTEINNGLQILPLIGGKRYIATGCVQGGSASKYRCRIYKKKSDLSGSDIYVGSDFGDGFQFTAEDDYIYLYQINILSGIDTTGFVFKPMIRLASDTDDTYVSYAMTNRELTEKLNGLYTKSVAIPESGYITVNFSKYFPIMVFGQRDYLGIATNNNGSISVNRLSGNDSSLSIEADGTDNIKISNIITGAGSFTVLIVAFKPFTIT